MARLRHFAFITNRTEDIALGEPEHRDHAVVEQVIADLKDRALQHFPSGEFNANGAWTVLGALARIVHEQLRPRWSGPLDCLPGQGFFELLKPEGPTREDHHEGDARWAPDHGKREGGRRWSCVACRQRAFEGFLLVRDGSEILAQTDPHGTWIDWTRPAQ